MRSCSQGKAASHSRLVLSKQLEQIYTSLQLHSKEWDASLNWKKMAGTLRGDLVRAAFRVDRGLRSQCLCERGTRLPEPSPSDTIHPFYRAAVNYRLKSCQNTLFKCWTSFLVCLRNNRKMCSINFSTHSLMHSCPVYTLVACKLSHPFPERDRVLSRGIF